MDEAKTNAHWKREQDNYLTQIGAMELIKRDPMASLGYKVRSANPNLTLEMGGNPPNDFYGLYQYFPGSHGGMDYRGPRFDGSLDVAVGLPQQRYAQTVAHELGHVGSRNSGSDFEISPPEEERRQRLVDYVNNPPGSPMHEDALYFLKNDYGLDTKDKLEAAANEVRAQLGLKSPSRAPKPNPKPQAEAAPKKQQAKRKTHAGPRSPKDK